jgi:cell division protein FtsL
MMKLAEKYKVWIVVIIVLWSAYCINATFQLTIQQRHIKQLEEHVAQLESEMDSTMDQEVDLELRLQKIEGK